jgi:hypothetical protein
MGRDIASTRCDTRQPCLGPHLHRVQAGGPIGCRDSVRADVDTLGAQAVHFQRLRLRHETQRAGPRIE